MPVLLLTLLTIPASALLAYTTVQFFEPHPRNQYSCLVNIEKLRNGGTLWIVAIFLLACAGPPVHYW